MYARGHSYKIIHGLLSHERDEHRWTWLIHSQRILTAAETMAARQRDFLKEAWVSQYWRKPNVNSLFRYQ